MIHKIELFIHKRICRRDLQGIFIAYNNDLPLAEQFDIFFFCKDPFCIFIADNRIGTVIAEYTACNNP